MKYSRIVVYSHVDNNIIMYYIFLLLLYRKKKVDSNFISVDVITGLHKQYYNEYVFIYFLKCNLYFVYNMNNIYIYGIM